MGVKCEQGTGETGVWIEHTGALSEWFRMFALNYVTEEEYFMSKELDYINFGAKF